MIKKLKSIYPEEEIVDGFSILCFEDQKKLEKFSSSLNKNVQRMILNEINRPKTNPTNMTNISQTPIISELKNKLNLTPTSPTRITAQRKSKPDMNTLTLAICCNKRRTQSISPIKNIDLNICCVEEDPKCADKENEDISKNNVLESVLPICQEKIKEIKRDSLQSMNDYYVSSNKEDSIFTDNSVNATSTLSPVSVQPSNCLQTDVESMDLDSPIKVVIDSVDVVDNRTTKDNLESDEKEISKIIVSGDYNNNEQYNGIDKDQSIKASDDIEDDDCVITSVGFDPAPKLNGITLSSIEHLLLDIPTLKPAPPFISPPSIKTILLENFQKSQPPPPLIPAPAYYFLTNLMVCKTNSTHNNNKNSKCISHKSIVSPKLKSPKRNMKSSILKSSTKSTKSSSTTSSIISQRNEQSPSNRPDKLQNSVVRSILQNTNYSNTKLYSINTLKNPTLTTLTTINNCKAVINTTTLTNIGNSSNRKISKLIPNSKIPAKFDNVPSYEPMPKRNCVKFPIIRKTQNHVDIAHFISKKISTKLNIDRPHSINCLIHKPQVLKPLYRPCVSLSHIASINSNQMIIPEAGNHLTFNFNKVNQHKFQNKLISPNNLFKQHNDHQVFIRPLNSVCSTFTTTNTVFLNSTVPNAVNFCSRPNLLLLQ